MMLLESRLEKSELWASKKMEASRELEKDLLCTRRRLWSSMKRAFIRPLGRLGSSPRTLTWAFLILSRT